MQREHFATGGSSPQVGPLSALPEPAEKSDLVSSLNCSIEGIGRSVCHEFVKERWRKVFI